MADSNTGHNAAVWLQAQIHYIRIQRSIMLHEYTLEKTWQGYVAKLSKAEPEVKRLLDRTFPSYRGRKIKLVFCESVTFSDLNWSGGSKNTYVLIRNDGAAAGLQQERAPWDQPMEGKTAKLTPEYLVAEHTMFCGKDCGVNFYIHTSLLPKWLPAPVEAQ